MTNLLFVTKIADTNDEVCDSENGIWYVLRSSDDSFFATQFGINGDIPALAQR